APAPLAAGWESLPGTRHKCSQWNFDICSTPGPECPDPVPAAQPAWLERGPAAADHSAVAHWRSPARNSATSPRHRPAERCPKWLAPFGTSFRTRRSLLAGSLGRTLRLSKFPSKSCLFSPLEENIQDRSLKVYVRLSGQPFLRYGRQ